jgi:hypothetical protein
MKPIKDFTLQEVARTGMYGEGGPEFLTLVRAALKVGKGKGYTEEELRGMTMEEIFGAEDEHA